MAEATVEKKIGEWMSGLWDAADATQGAEVQHA